MVGPRRSALKKKQDVERAWRRSLRAAVAGDWSAAETWLERIVEADSGDLDAYHALARLYRQQGEVGRAIRMHQNLLLRSDLDREARREALLELARDFDVGGYRERAVAAYEEYLGEVPRQPEALERLVRLLHDLGEFPRALALVRRLRRRDRQLGDQLEREVLLSHAERLFEAGDHEGARKVVKRCLRRDKHCGRGWALLGELEAERGKTVRALAAWKKAARAAPEIDVDLLPKLAATFAARGKPEDFDRFVEGLLEERPNDPAATIALARARAARGDSGGAVEILARAVEAAPEALDLHAELGRQLIAAGQEAEALKAYGALVEAIERGQPGADA
ncbi:MAG TPA: tetratricopeptide repeat protein [Deltaproteobacteria bacterium]|nr:tetratricopeptide repeat protein [Deltaproteobacteria bacterium]